MKRIVMLIGMSLLMAVLVACGGEESSKTNADVIQQFKDDGVEVGETSELPNKEFGNTRAEGTRILVPSLGDDAGGRLFKFDKEGDLKDAKAYYDDLGAAGSMFYSHTHQAGDFLLQMSGDMTDEDFKKYADSLDKANE